MKKGTVKSYIYDIKHSNEGEQYSVIFSYFYREFITTLVLYVALHLIDSYYISCLKDCALYNTLGFSNTIFHFLIKVAEGFSVGLIILCGQYNGAKDYSQAGKSLKDGLMLNLILGIFISSILFFCSYNICFFYGVPSSVIDVATSFFKLKALGVFLLFLYLTFVGFLRSIKNTKIPMLASFAGAFVFLFTDTILIFGGLGIQPLGLLGSAIATISQYSIMCLICFFYIFKSKETKKFNIDIFSKININNIINLVRLSIPVIIDKATLAICGLWLAKLMNLMATQYYQEHSEMIKASFFAIKDLERCALLPGLAFAQVITFLVSNDYKVGNWQSIKVNIKKIVFASSIIVASFLLVISLFPKVFLQLFDQTNVFTNFAAKIIPFISILVIFDLIQLILSAALRGAANVKMVMVVRLITCSCFFIPISYMLAQAQINNIKLQFILVYSVLYISNALMAIVYIKRFKGQKWKNLNKS